MSRSPDINEYVNALRASARMGSQVAYATLLPPSPASHAAPEQPWPAPIPEILQSTGIDRLYAHQAKAIDAVREGCHVVVATPTASGKSLIYNLPVMEQIRKDPEARALYLFPLKALAQDQLRAFSQMAQRIGGTAAIYDGDTTAWHRKKIRENPPHVVLSNPEMLHLSFLPYHEKWAAFFSRLRIVVVDEVHTYRGVMGSHMAQVFRRFQRVCAHYGADPTFVFSSATVGNPGDLAQQLTGLSARTLTKSGAPQGKKHLLCLAPDEGPVRSAILLLKAALHRGLRTIVYTQSRKMTELIALWAGSQAGRFAHQISPYRAGLLPEERRAIEAKLSSGELLAVISTSALELGIDVGDLDLCLLVGYPGTIVATWQRGGRVGRAGQDSAVVLIGGEDALDQYILRHPEALLDRPPEDAVVNPYNPHILKKHLICAAAEHPLRADESWLEPGPVQAAIRDLEMDGELLVSGDGKTIYSRQKAPHRRVDLRGTGTRFQIIEAASGKSLGEIDGFRAFRETHPGAIYLHNGQTFHVEALDPDTRTIRISPARADYYTRVRANKSTEILEVAEGRAVANTRCFLGRLKVTDQVTGYERLRIHGRQKINVIPLELPPQIFETEGLWFEIPAAAQERAEAEYLHFMGGIHAIEHAAIGVFPLLVMTDRNDLGGISTPFHPQVGGPAVFIYDGIPGGAGLTRQAFKKARDLLESTFQAIARCECQNGCPSCVHSPKCGSGNRPIDKDCALFLLRWLREETKETRQKLILRKKQKPGKNPPSAQSAKPSSASSKAVKARSQPIHGRYGVLDLETQRSAQEVGGWHRAERMGISCGVLYDSKSDRYHEYLEDHIPEMIAHMQALDLVIGFNIKRFDYRVLGGYSAMNFGALPTLDILEEVKNRLGYRLSLDHLARVTLGSEKIADGLQALRWWKQGRINEIVAYCKSDVQITRDLFLHGYQNGYLLFENKAGKVVRVPVRWENL